LVRGLELEFERMSEPVLLEHLLSHMFELCFYTTLGSISTKGQLLNKLEELSKALKFTDYSL